MLVAWRLAGLSALERTMRCGRYGRCNVKQLIAAHGSKSQAAGSSATLANCEKRAGCSAAWARVMSAHAIFFLLDRGQKFSIAPFLALPEVERAIPRDQANG